MGSWLKGIPPPAWTKRPNAKDDLRELAIAMRRDGKSYREIREALGVSKGSLSLWLRDVHLSEEHRAALQERQVAGRERAVETLKARRVARERTIVREAAPRFVSWPSRNSLSRASSLTGLKDRRTSRGGEANPFAS